MRDDICYDFDDDNTLSSINSSKFKNILNIIYVKKYKNSLVIREIM